MNGFFKVFFLEKRQDYKDEGCVRDWLCYKYLQVTSAEGSKHSNVPIALRKSQAKGLQPDKL